jgi:hypothetical protein
MPIRISTKLANYLCDENCLTTLINTGFGKLMLFSTVQPATPEMAQSGLLATIDNDGAGLSIGTPTDGVCEMVAPWAGVGSAAGTAKSFRFCAEETDDGVSATTDFIRIDGSVGAIGSTSDATVDNTSISVDQAATVVSFYCGISRGW